VTPKKDICACENKIVNKGIENSREENKGKNGDINKNEYEEEDRNGEKGDYGHFELVVIDVNYFPSYKEVPDFPRRLRKFLRQKAGMPVYT
jgi:hypothetical protein